jgi:NADH:ubiquinone oxidoreductase subunit E
MKKHTVIEDLHQAQEKDRKHTYLKEGNMQDVANGCGVPASQVYGVATFYTMFSTKPRGKHVIRICRNLACHLGEAESVVKALRAELGVDIGGTSRDGEFTLEESSCLGMCAVAPAMMVDDKPYGNLTAAGVRDILQRIKNEG